MSIRLSIRLLTRLSENYSLATSSYIYILFGKKIVIMLALNFDIRWKLIALAIATATWYLEKILEVETFKPMQRNFCFAIVNQNGNGCINQAI